ncbi:MAG: GxxExxY protein [Phycisphaerales bacterium]
MEGELRDPLTHAIIGGAIQVHKALGPGMLESVYEQCLAIELADRGLHVRRQVEVPIVFKGRSVPAAFRMDMLVNEEVILELKAVETVLPVHEVQLMTYMRMAGKKKGLLFNFHSAYLRDTIVRRVL